MVKTGQFYAGSTILLSLVPVIGLPIDQINFLTCQFIALLLGTPFRKVLSPRHTSPTVRHVVELLVGLALAVFCFGYQIWHLFFQSTLCYLLMKYFSSRHVHKLIFIVAMGYLCAMHIYRQMYDYGGYTMDITGPMMVMTQKLTSLACSLHDGQKVNSELSAGQQYYAVRHLPSILNFYSYMFYFHGIMCGPLSFYADYVSFIEGRWSYIKAGTEKDKVPERVTVHEIPSTLKPVVSKFVVALTCGLLMMVMPSLIPTSKLYDPDFIQTSSLFYKTVYMVVSITFVREKYYFAWVLADTLNNAAGLGFDGYDKAGNPKWDLLTNVNIIKLELSTSLKMIIDNWNITTLMWLRQVVYDRVPKYNMLAVFACSAVWHGFYPGYYITFGSAALFTTAARLVRRRVRPYFLKSNMQFLYDGITFIFTKITNAYLVIPFIFLEFVPSIEIYMSQYCWLHVAVVMVILVLSLKRTNSSPKQKDVKRQS